MRLLSRDKAVLELPVDLAGDVALEASADLAVGLAVAAAPFDVGAGGRIVSGAVEDDDVNGSIELAVAASIESVPVLVLA